MHCSKAATLVKLTKAQDEDDFIDTEKLAKQIKCELKECTGIKDQYPVLDEYEISNSISPTLNSLLLLISPQFKDNEKAVALICSIISSITNSHTSMLQVALGLMISQKKTIQDLHEYRVTSTYDEVRRFRISAAHHASQKKDMALNSENGLIQGIADNFDANLSTQNGLQQTHSLASIVVQPSANNLHTTREPIPRLKKGEMSSVIIKEPEWKVYKGEKRPKMPALLSQRGVFPLKVLCSQQLSTKQAQIDNFQFIKDVLSKPSTPDFGGYNTQKMRESNTKINSKSTILYNPLINNTPSDPSTILTAMCDIENTTHQAGQSVTVFTCDQQLFRVTLDIIWDDPARWRDFYPRLGGMHWLMSFIGSIGKLMKNSGLDRLLKTTFGGVDKMLIGKKFPQNVRALRIIVIEMLRPLISQDTTESDFTATMEELCKKSVLAEHWINNLVRPVLLVMMYIQAERNGKFDLHLHACKQMLPFFFAAGHWNYARDGVVYLRMMESLPSSLVNKFMQGEHIVHLKDGYFNGLWSDMAIEMTYMNVGKGQDGIIGVTTSERSVSIWANSHHSCGELLMELKELCQKQTSTIKHKEEYQGRIKSDANDRQKIRSALEKCIHPLQIETHESNKLVNIYTGEESDKDTNVNKAETIGKTQMKSFENELPESFRKPLTTKVMTMTSSKEKQSKKKVDKEEYNTDLLFLRALLSIGTHQVGLNEMFSYELSQVPLSLFHASGEPRYPANKSALMNKLRVEVSSRGIEPETIVIDGGGMLHRLYWPSNGTVNDLLDVAEKYIMKQLNESNVYLVFDRYIENSIKSDTRDARIGAFHRSYQLSPDRELPPKEMCLKSTKTKETLIELIANELSTRVKKSDIKKQLVITAKSSTPIMTYQGDVQPREDLDSNYDEADYMIPQQVNAIFKEKKQTVVKVLSNDTDVFVLLCSHFLKFNWSSLQLYMGTFGEDTKMISINKSVADNYEIIPSLAAVHAISGCDYVPMMFGIGKLKALKAAYKMHLKHIGDIAADLDEVIKEGKQFVAECYGQKCLSSSINRAVMWKHKTDGAKKSAKPPALKSLPPTDEALEMNIKRAHFVAIMWNNCTTGCPPQIDPCEYGWKLGGDRILKPTKLPPAISIAPEDILKTTRCKCISSQCKTNKCSCTSAGLRCTHFCQCQQCENQDESTTGLDDTDESDAEELELC